MIKFNKTDTVGVNFESGKVIHFMKKKIQIEISWIFKFSNSYGRTVP